MKFFSGFAIGFFTTSVAASILTAIFMVAVRWSTWCLGQGWTRDTDIVVDTIVGSAIAVLMLMLFMMVVAR